MGDKSSPKEIASPPRDAPLVLIGRDGRRRVITALDANAEGFSLRVGIPVAKAQALVSELIVMEANHQADAEGLEKLALWALQHISPVVVADAPDGLVIDTTGADHLHGGEAAMLTTIVKRFAVSGVEARAAVSNLVIPQGNAEVILRPLPIAALRLDPTIVMSLRTVGFERVADVMDQPRAPLWPTDRPATRPGARQYRRTDRTLPGSGDHRGSASLSARPRRSHAISASWSTRYAPRSKRRGLVRANSIFCFTASATPGRRSGWEPPSRSATPNG